MNNNIKKVLKNFKNFGFSYGSSYLFTKTIFRKYEYKTRLKALKILDDKLGYIYKIYKEKGVSNNLFAKNIFFFWAQGFDNLPDVPALCLKQIKKFYPDYKLFTIDLNNFADYIDIDKNIIDLFNKGNISIQTFSDILRFNLIYKYGGVWCDATLLFFERVDFEKEISLNAFYSLNVDCKEKENLWGKVYPVTYTTFFFAACKGSYVLKALCDSFDEYYKKFDFVIDYFLNDYFFILAMKHELEDNILGKIRKGEGNPFYLLNCLQNSEEINFDECKKVPQKITWRNISLNRITEWIKD